MSINDDVSAALFDYYGTARADDTDAAVEDQTKLAQFEYLYERAKTAGLDVDNLTEDQWQSLYDQSFAENTETDADQPAEKTAAEAEFEAAKLASDAFADADARGRVQAHAFMDEMNKIAKSRSGASMPTEGATKVRAERLSNAAKYEGASQAGRGHSGGKSVGKVEAGAREAGAKARGMGNKASRAVSSAVRYMKAHPKASIGTAAGTALAAGGGAAAYHFGKKKEASALDFEGAKLACLMVEEAGLESAEMAADRFDALFADGLPETDTKIASGGNYEEGVHIRALELAEMMGYPVQWND